MRIPIAALVAAFAAVSLPLAAAAQTPTPTPKLPFVTGLVFTDPVAYQSIPLALAPLMGELPKKADLSPNFPKPGHQGQQSSCVGWALAYALKSFQEQQERQWGADTHTFSAAYIYNQVKQPGPGCMQGTQYVDALNLLTREGVATSKDFPYVEGDCSKKPTAAQKQAAQEFAVASWRRVNVQDETEMKAHIASGFPVLIGSQVDYAFMTLQRGGVYSNYAGPNVGAHAMTVVGYDDTKSAFRLINSWGTGWGDGGFAWVSYGAFRQMVREGYVVQDIVVSRPQPTPTQVVANTTPTPIPPPVTPIATPWVNPKSPLVSVQPPVITHNIQTPLGWAMSIQLPGQIQNAKGHSAQIVVRFAFSNGAPVMANVAEMQYRDATGLTATGTSKFVVTADPQDLSATTMMIPYYALNLAPTNGMMSYSLLANAQVYIDDFPIAQSGWTPLAVRW